MGNKSVYSKPEYFYNRELSWISFNYRVLEEAQDKTIPLKAIGVVQHIYKFLRWPNPQGVLHLDCPAADDFLWGARINTGKRIFLAKLLNFFQLIEPHTVSSK